MTYEIQIKLLIKTMGKEYTDIQMRNLILAALWKVPEFRDVDLYEYEGDTDSPGGSMFEVKELPKNYRDALGRMGIKRAL